jgi:hypothetical protein
MNSTVSPPRCAGGWRVRVESEIHLEGRSRVRDRRPNIGALTEQRPSSLHFPLP